MFYWKPRRSKAEQFTLRRDEASGLLEISDPNHQTQIPEVVAGLPEDVQAVLLAIPLFPETINRGTLFPLFKDRYSESTMKRYVRQLRDKGLVLQLSPGLYTRKP